VTPIAAKEERVVRQPAVASKSLALFPENLTVRPAENQIPASDAGLGGGEIKF